MPRGLVAAARIRVPTTGRGMPTCRVTAGCSTRMSSTSTRMSATSVRMSTADVRMPTTSASARVRSASTGIPMRSTAAGVTTLIARYRRAVVLRAGTTVPRRATVMCYRPAVRSTSMRSNDAFSRELTRSRRRGHTRSAVVERRTQLSVARSGVLMVSLHRRGLDVMIMFRGELVRSRMRPDATGTVERHVVAVIDEGPVVYVRDVDTTHVHSRAVVEKGTPAPVTAFESNTAIAEAVIHTAVEADMRTPVAHVPGVEAPGPTPVARRPQ